MKKIFQYIRPYLLRMAFGFSIKFLGTIMDLLIPWVLAYIIDEVIPQKNIEKVLLWGAMMLLFSFLGVCIYNTRFNSDIKMDGKKDQAAFPQKVSKAWRDEWFCRRNDIGTENHKRIQSGRIHHK